MTEVATDQDWRLGHTALPTEQRTLLSRAKRLEVISLVYLLSCVVIVYLVMGSSQAMKAAWIEDLLSLIPPAAFLFAVHRTRRGRSVSHPYGHHRTVAAAHLAAAVALLTMGLFLVYDSGSGPLAVSTPDRQRTSPGTRSGREADDRGHGLLVSGHPRLDGLPPPRACMTRSSMPTPT